MINRAFSRHPSIFIPFVVSGYPNMTHSTQAVLALAAAGADVIEIGVPFSDPIADGPVNQNAAAVALSQRVTLSTVLSQIHDIRKHGCRTPIILFSYLNPILAFGQEAFCEQAVAAGANGILVVDLPPEEGAEFYQHAQKRGLEIVLLASPTTSKDRFSFYRRLKPAFVYYISRLAVTGTQHELSNSLQQEVAALYQMLPDTKIAVGFGISSPDQARQVSQIADGVIIGSQLVTTLGRLGINALKKQAAEYVKIIHQEAQ